MTSIIQPSPGFKWNPLRNHRRNDPCVCGSNVKIKKCCGKHISVPDKIHDLIVCMINKNVDAFNQVVGDILAEEDAKRNEDVGKSNK